MRPRLTETWEAAKSFLDLLAPADSVQVVGFAQHVKVLGPMSSNRDSASKAIALTSARGNTALYDALFTSVELLKDRPGRKALSLQPEFRLRLRKTVDRELEVILGVSRRNLGPDSRGALRYHWVKESDHIQPKLEQAISDFLGEGSLTDHNRHDRMLSRSNREAAVSQTFAEELGAVLQTIPKFRGTSDDLDCL